MTAIICERNESLLFVNLTLIFINNGSAISSCQQWINCAVNACLAQVQPDLLAEMHLNYFRVTLSLLLSCSMVLKGIMSLIPVEM